MRRTHALSVSVGALGWRETSRRDCASIWSSDRLTDGRSGRERCVFSALDEFSSDESDMVVLCKHLANTHVRYTHEQYSHKNAGTAPKTGRVQPTRCDAHQAHPHGRMGPLRGEAHRHPHPRGLASRNRVTDVPGPPIRVENVQRHMQHTPLLGLDRSLPRHRSRDRPRARSLPLVSLTLDASSPFHIPPRYSGQLLLLVGIPSSTSDRVVRRCTGRDCRREAHSRQGCSPPRRWRPCRVHNSRASPTILHVPHITPPQPRYQTILLYPHIPCHGTPRPSHL